MSFRSKTQRMKAAIKSAAKTWTAFVPVSITEQMKQDNPALLHCTAMYANSVYQAELFNCASEIGGVAQLVVRRHMDLGVIPWDDLQRVKNDIFGPEYTAVEVYPPAELAWKIGREVRILWILPVTYNPPFGLWLPTSWGRTGEA